MSQGIYLPYCGEDSKAIILGERLKSILEKLSKKTEIRASLKRRLPYKELDRYFFKECLASFKPPLN